MLDPKIVYEDNHLLVLDKPAGLPTAGVTGAASIYQWTGDYWKKKYQKPGNVYVGIVSRLDRVTSGLIVVARTSKAADRLSQQIRERRITKQYVAILAGSIHPQRGHLVDQLFKDEHAQRMRVAGKNRTHPSQQAELAYETVDRWTIAGQPCQLVRIELITGRKHQIRAQFSARGCPIWGDSKYGFDNRRPAGGNQPLPGILLHSCQLKLQHPTKKEPLAFVAPTPQWWNRIVPAAHAQQLLRSGTLDPNSITDLEG